MSKLFVRQSIIFNLADFWYPYEQHFLQIKEENSSHSKPGQKLELHTCLAAVK